jgi:hypothetical protein
VIGIRSEKPPCPLVVMDGPESVRLQPLRIAAASASDVNPPGRIIEERF